MTSKSLPIVPLGNPRSLNQARYSSGRSHNATPKGGYFEGPNMPKGICVAAISAI